MADYYNKYLKYKQKYLKKKLELSGKSYNTKSTLKLRGGSYNTTPTLVLFKADWCGHCNAFKNDWHSLNNDSELKKTIKFIEYDSDLHNNEINKFNIKGYPTLLFNINNKYIEYEGNRNISDIKKFINNYI